MTERVGIGWDSHRLAKGRTLVLGGERIAHHQGLLGHSDADVLLHAVIDALLGAAALGDIGGHFPDTDETYRNISSLELLRRTGILLEQAGWRAVNIDATIIAEQPRLAPHIICMRHNIAAALLMEDGAVSVKAKTAEGLDSAGRGDSMQAQAIALIEKIPR